MIVIRQVSYVDIAAGANMAEPPPEITTILYVAYRDRFREGLQAVLQAWGRFDNVVCQEPATAVAALSAGPIPTLSILDADVLDALPWPEWRAWRAGLKESPLLVLISTGQQRSQATSLGANSVLLKGFSTETLYRTITALLGPACAEA